MRGPARHQGRPAVGRRGSAAILDAIRGAAPV